MHVCNRFAQNINILASTPTSRVQTRNSFRSSNLLLFGGSFLLGFQACTVVCAALSACALLHHWYQPLQAFPGEVVVGALPRMPLLCFASVCSLGQCQRHLHTHHVQVSHMQLLWFALLCSLGRDHWHPQRLFWNHLTCEYSLVSSQLCQVCRSHACRCSHCHQTHPQTCVFSLFPCQLLHPSSYPGFSWFSSQAVSWVPPGFSGHPHRLSCLS